MFMLMQLFKYLFASIEELTRKEIGHQLNDIVIQCYYNGKNCDRRYFTQISSLAFGNCFTLECDQYISRESGPDKGLTLVLRVQVDEYIPTISESKGVQVVIHERNTIAFPEEDGIALATGTDTKIAIKQVEITRLDQPYGECSPNELFKKNFGVGPTRNEMHYDMKKIYNVIKEIMTCMKVCEQKLIIEECGCYDILRQEINEIVNMSKDVVPCTSHTQWNCTRKVETMLEDHWFTCNCNNPCNELKFEKTVSMRHWPSAAYLKLLMSSVCIKQPRVCDKLRNKTTTELSEEFLKVNIYFEDLNYVKLSETADYERAQFLSDIGGTIGLWIGLSLLGLCEILHLVNELLIFFGRTLCCPQKVKKYNSF